MALTHTTPITKEEIHRMNERIIHRGPDDEGIYIDPRHRVGLGHRRLSIVDLSPAGHQPMSNPEKTVWITFNGEIYNFASLRADLEKKGYQFQSRTDTEVIIYLWQEYGERCVSFLRGMFAFAIWDEQKQIVFLARDRLGKKPLKYYIGPDTMVFASELKAFLGEPGVPREVDYEAIYHYLTLQYVPHPLTGFARIYKLPAAHYLTVDLAHDKPIISEPIQYWNLDYSKKLNLPEEEWKERIIDKLDECVKLRMIADVPLGAFLSGGVDSSGVVAFMAKNSPRPVKTFSIGFTEKSFNELPYARMMATRYGTEHQEFIVEPDAMTVLPHLVYHYEEPYADSSAIPTYYISKITRTHATVALNGDGGDENFAGYPWYRVLFYASLYQKTPWLFRKVNHRLTALLARLFSTSSLLTYGLTYAKGSLSASIAYTHSELLAYIQEEQKNAAFIPPHGASTHTILERYYAEAANWDLIDKAVYADIHTYLQDDLLTKVDIATMSVSLEGRSPLLDHEFMEMTTMIPANLKVTKKENKYIFKKALEPFVPKELMYRKKRGFSIPINHWLRTSLCDYAQEILSDDHAFTKEILGRDLIPHLWENHLRGKKEGKKIWALLTLELWHRQFFSS
ncbi:MAG: asparagine synthase (glutamine-hydrolyzing) [Candidatus Magasanikbacteria bacterium RIFCSPLOWO2_12_FULL_47_9b]|nr:MAG: asparagine synthase (glutamine-hydrolyzing) [Candidatus Magasanikbacteria bacterium RIFCSPLOWO2_12_FULL_47_9b]